MRPVASQRLSLHAAYRMDDVSAVLGQAFDATPGSIRELARAAGVSETLLRLARDGNRRLTPETREKVVEALRAWEAACREAADGLEAANLGPRERGDDG